MRVLYIITQASPWGGAQRYVHDATISLHRDGWPVTVASGGGARDELFQKLNAAGVSTRSLPSLGRAVNPLKNLKAIFEIRALCRELKPDVVHLNSSMAGVVGALGARLAGVKKIIYTVHGLVTKEPLPFPAKGAYWLAEWIAGKFRDLTICVSENDRRAVITQRIAPPARTVTIPIGIDPHIPFLTREEARKKLMALLPTHPVRFASTPPQEGNTSTAPSREGSPSDGRPVDAQEQGWVWIGAIAGLYKTKGLDTLVEAAYQLIHSCRDDYRSPAVGEYYSPLQFIIIGEGPERPTLQRLIETKKLTHTVFLLGSLPDAARYLQAFDVFVLPSRKEGMPYTILEALLAGIPVIATHVGGIPEVFDGFKNLRSQNVEALYRLIPPHSPTALVEAIEAFVTKERGVIPLSSKVSRLCTVSSMIEHTVTEYSRLSPRARQCRCRSPA
ncbi:hypothetical protein A3J43_00065 [Candidatus Uhrbacteria bacterium RIFCSPHIGHO2_12_FULL_54_23]|uniref:Glycosyltransferase subfamily 4-like N-terminal domain-containing protein n=2 Tax=Candidatus Uhriibacteriota TaxID=1752732 RepID=A0A1F7UFX4_9BACT|nr:MAG: hypothetical protein A3J43_00065 [Candidatus Uhrbacteria bacterium RIFCSPHIGHO2_12_FULL_54_23]OGL90091.1 MAG: hypothetical protein A3J36_01425 [Candidatus Uhrbacteria bacterium RIFCSPLOWO2_02_FULL_54_37]